MSGSTKWNRTATSIAMIVVLGAGLVGCAGFNPLESVIEQATGGEVDLGGAELPDGFPVDDVPLYDGEVLFGAAVGGGADNVWNVTVRVPDAAAIDEIRADLEAAGFESGFEGPTGADGGTVVATSDAYGVLAVVAADSDGFVANYTVTARTAE